MKCDELGQKDEKAFEDLYCMVADLEPYEVTWDSRTVCDAREVFANALMMGEDRGRADMRDEIRDALEELPR